MESGTTLFLMGAAVALVSSVVTALIQHALWLRSDRIRRQRDREERRALAMRMALKSRLSDSDEELERLEPTWNAHSEMSERGLDALFSPESNHPERDAGASSPEKPPADRRTGDDPAEHRSASTLSWG
jgi:hypothetical protein